MFVSWLRTAQNTRGSIKMGTGMIRSLKAVNGNAKNVTPEIF